MQRTPPLLKNPKVYKLGHNSNTSHQLKRLLQKKHIHRYSWDKLTMYDPRRLVHTNKRLDHFTYANLPDPHRSATTYWVPDQEFLKVPVPVEFSDAYWWRELQARRIQCPIEWVEHRHLDAQKASRVDFQDLSMKKKFFVRDEQAVRYLLEKRQ